MALRLVPLFWVVILSCAGCACDPSGAACRGNSDCERTELCIDMRCVPQVDPGLDGGLDAALDASDAACTSACGGACCRAGEICYAPAATCVPDRGACAGPDECGQDSWCAPLAPDAGTSGICVPFGVPPTRTADPSCTRPIDIESIVPDLQCSWLGPPAGDAFPLHFQVMSTPVVVDFDFDDDPATLRPSIVFASFPTVGAYTQPGVLRVVDGGTCEHQFTLAGSDRMVMSPAAPSVGDLDGDGRAEIVAVTHDGGVLAWRWDPATDAFAFFWRSATCAGARTPDTTGGTDRWSGVSIHDLDDDGLAEVIYGRTVYRGTDGCIAGGDAFPDYHRGVVPVIADVDEDGAMELVQGDGVYAWSGSGWTLEPYFTATGLTAGQVAVADLGTFPLSGLGGGDRAEIAVVAGGTVRVQTLEGRIVFGPIAFPGGGVGGAPTIADFDGDGQNEVASAGGTRYVVFDLDCVAGGDASGCGGMARTDGVLWQQPSQDASSNTTGSSVFDFDADGAAEAVYADECFLRIYDGATGGVLYSAARSSGTTYENPVMVDVDGDFHTEIVSSVNDYAGSLGCPATDPLRPTTAFATSHGIVVLRDVMDRWAASRPVWNQHAYAVTHVGDRGETLRTSAVAINWRTSGLDNFRQNVQGDLSALGTPDLTASEISDRLRLPCDTEGRATLRARVCNRGALPMAAGFEVSFRSGARDGAELCRASSATFLDVGRCDEVECVAPLPAGMAIDVYVVADPDETSAECHEGNNWGLQPNVACDTVD